jgi:ubiquinone/menaquinone biosynthesis C-methylase UbiE
MMNTDLYEDFAGRYDLEPESLVENDSLIVEFFCCVFAENGIQSVLDCACGTGRHILLYNNLGCEAWGSDISKAMLIQSRKNLAHYLVDIVIRNADYRNLPQHFHRSFGAVTCLGSIGYMPDEKQTLRAFSSMYAVLRDGRLLILTSIPTDKQWKEKPRFSLSINTPDVTRLFVMDYFERSVRYNLLDIYHNKEANELKLWNVELTVLLMDNLERLWKEAGFQRVVFYGSLDFAPYDKVSSDRLITVAYK